jgi:hypothetical protein
MADNKAEIVVDGNATGWRRAMQEIVQSSRDGTKQVEVHFGVLARTAETVRGHVAALAAVFAGIAAAGIKSAASHVDALNDVADATGASIENLSALEDVARRTGTTMDVVGAALVKFNQALNAATPDSSVASALKAIGLNAQDLKRMDPAEALHQVALALDGFADDGNKARLVQELFGKSLREVAPLLHDLAEKGRLNATVTRAQAAEAETFNKSLFGARTELENMARSISAAVLPQMTRLMEQFSEGIRIAGGFGQHHPWPRAKQPRPFSWSA